MPGKSPVHIEIQALLKSHLNSSTLIPIRPSMIENPGSLLIYIFSKTFYQKKTETLRNGFPLCSWLLHHRWTRGYLLQQFLIVSISSSHIYKITGIHFIYGKFPDATYLRLLEAFFDPLICTRSYC